MSLNPKRTANQPHDRLTEVTGVMVAALESLPDSEDLKAIVFVNDGERGGTCMHNYDGDDIAAAADAIEHVAAILEVQGKELRIRVVDKS